MPSSRRRLLRSCGTALVVGVAGCLSTGLSDDAVPTPTDCPHDPQVPESEPHPDGEALPPVPEPPESLNDEGAAKEYVRAYELAYQWREVTTWFGDPIVSVSVDAVPSVREARDELVIVDLHLTPFGRVDFGQGAPGHFDGRPYTVSYLVTREAVWRASREYQTSLERDRDTSELEPHEDGELLECY